ncbi:glycoside hydrolase family 5 protein [Deminuibacter soli]|uniref:Glycoside hydrolase family 5 protein n=1 Tax=Deminuibacter soli TaxID=2291815 RepID=A0A3E1NJ00_9BACT|nr:cellulase family glycosylhydrolase [Deminuibacter soli]RFM27758.1 glycoside hydrolase family 5 protein [Deminuibacter soli]
MYKQLLTIVAFALTAFAAHAQTPSNGFFNVKGKEIVDQKGKPFLMKGINLGNWLVPEGYMLKLGDISAPRLINETIMELIGRDSARLFWQQYLNNYITRADIQYLKKLGMNSIRIPFNYRLFTKEDYLASNDDQRGFVLLDRVIGWCKEAGLYVILDMHCAPGGQTGDNIDDSYGYPFLFDSEESQQQTADIWKKIAAHYRNETTIIGYDLLNEPIAHYFNTSYLNPKLEPVYKKITAAVRSVDGNHLLFLGGAQWDSNFKIFGAPFDKKLVYTFHKYWSDTTQNVIQEYIDFRDKYNVPIYIGETGENTDAWIKSFRVLLEKNNIGWHYWPYKKMDNVKGIAEFKQPDLYDLVIQYAQSTRTTFADLRKAAPEDRAKIHAALAALLVNCRFENCTPNKGYIAALGLGE